MINNGIYLVIGTENCIHHSIEKIVEDALKAGIVAIQLREKKLGTKSFINVAEKLHAITKSYNIPLIINDRIDIALAIDAEGVHIGQQDMPYNLARKILGDKKIIGISTNNVQDVQTANQLNVDYIGIGPVFNTNTKDISDRSILGAKKAMELFALSKHKAFAIGGIQYSNAAEVLKSVPTGIAVVSAIAGSDKPYQSACDLVNIMPISFSKK